MAEQQTESYKKKQEELRLQYEKEQDLYTNKAIMSKESKEKLSVNFLYEPPPGTKKDREREDDEPEFKFEWQRKYNAPRESYCKGDQEIRDQPFGIQVRNVRCIKCHKWGHINTDKECPMYNQSGAGSEASSSLNPSELIRQMREDGLAMKKGAVGLLELPNCPSNVNNQQLIPSSSEDEDHMNESELKFLEGLSTKKKLKLLRKLEKMEKKKKKKKKLKKEKRKDEKKRDRNSDSSGSDTDSSGSKKKKKKAKDNRKSLNGQVKLEKDDSVRSSERKDIENDLFTVLGRKMDFEGPPQQSSSNRGQFEAPYHDQFKGRRRKPSHSRSNSQGRSRSRTPTRERKQHEHKYKDDRPMDDYKRRPIKEERNGHTSQRSVGSKNRSISPADDRQWYSDKMSSRGRRDRSSSRENLRRFSPPRSREPRRYSRSPNHESKMKSRSSNRH